MINLNNIKKFLNVAKNVEQTGYYHKENLYVHTIMVSYDLLINTNDIVFVLSGLLHDTGKIETAKFNEDSNSWSFKNHSYFSTKKLTEFITSDDENFLKVKSIVENHMLPFEEEGFNSINFKMLDSQIQNYIKIFNQYDLKNSIQEKENIPSDDIVFNMENEIFEFMKIQTK